MAKIFGAHFGETTRVRPRRKCKDGDAVSRARDARKVKRMQLQRPLVFTPLIVLMPSTLSTPLALLVVPVALPVSTFAAAPVTGGGATGFTGGTVVRPSVFTPLIVLMPSTLFTPLALLVVPVALP